MNNLLKLRKNDTAARWMILIASFVVFAAVVFLSRVSVDVDLGFDKHLFAQLNACINSMVSVLLIAAYIAVRKKRYKLHQQLILVAICLSVLFLVSYIMHHLFTGETTYGGEGAMRYVYYIVLITHILLAAIILPFILFTAYRATVGEWKKHKKLAKITWPIWLYVSITGVVVYLMISPYYT